MAGDPIEDIWVGICGVSWISQGPWWSRGCARGNWFKHQPPPPRQIEIAGVGGARGGLVQTPTTPTKTDRDIRAAELEVRKGDQVIKPTPPNQDGQRQRGGSQRSRSYTRETVKYSRTWTDRLTRAAQDAVLVGGGKRSIREACHRGAHSEACSSSAHSEDCSSSNQSET